MQRPTIGPRRPGRQLGNSYVSDICTGLHWRCWLPLVFCELVISSAYSCCLPAIGSVLGVDVQAIRRTHRFGGQPPLWLFAVVVAPIAEEFSFRYALVKLQAFCLVTSEALGRAHGAGEETANGEA